MFRLDCLDGKARLGFLKTAHAIVETPFFMPVATKMAVKYVPSEFLGDIGVQSIISNAFILSLKPGVKSIEDHGGIHEMMNFHGNIFTDSGGFQKSKESLYIGSTDDGVLFRSPFDGVKHLLTPQKAMDIEHSIGSDVAMVIDEMPLPSQSKDEVALATERTHLWAEQCLEHHKKINKKRQLLFGIAQGGVYPDLRKKSAEFISNLDFDGVAFGGLAIGEPDEKMYEMVNLSVDIFPENKPRYLMGVGNPVHIINAVSHGVDCFDSTFPTQNARHFYLFTHSGKLRLERQEYKNDEKPIDKDCDCMVCQNYSRAFLRHLIKTNEPNGLIYASYHNVFFMMDFMRKIRSAIKENRFDDYKKEFLRSWTS